MYTNSDEMMMLAEGLDQQSINSINSLDMNRQNKATVLKKAGSTRRNLPQLNFKEVKLTSHNHHKSNIIAAMGSNNDLVELDLVEAYKNTAGALPVIDQDVREDAQHFRSQLEFSQRDNAQDASFYTERQGIFKVR